MAELFNLQRFIDAQAHQYDNAISELKSGRKRTHWIWFIFPQLKGLGHSDIARHYAIKSLAEARAYLDHPLLGARLKECTLTVLNVEGRSAHEIFGHPDDLKFLSCMTLFSAISAPGTVFEQAIDKYYNGIADQATLSILQISRESR